MNYLKNFRGFLIESNSPTAGTPENLDDRSDLDPDHAYKYLVGLGLIEPDIFKDLLELHKMDPEKWGKPKIDDDYIEVVVSLSVLYNVPDSHYNNPGWTLDGDTARIIIDEKRYLEIEATYLMDDDDPYYDDDDDDEDDEDDYNIGANWMYTGPIKLTDGDSLMQIIDSFNSTDDLDDPTNHSENGEWSHD
jgi:hypothetical protein